MRIALLQLNLTVGDLAGNARRIEAAVHEAARLGAAFAVTSELALFGYPPRDLLLDPGQLARAGQVLQHLATGLLDSIPVLVGTALQREAMTGRPVQNGAVLLKQGQIHPAALKVLLPTYDVFDEDRYFEPGSGGGLIEIGGERVGVTICEDLWNDNQFWAQPRYHRDPLAELASSAQPPRLIINLSSSPFYRGKQYEREALLAHAARRHRQTILYVNQVGGNDELIFDGRSCAFKADGTLLGRARAFAEDLLLVDTEVPGRIEFSPVDEAEIWEALVLGSRDYARKCGFAQGLVAVSGGIDSALTLAIVAAALGPEHVLAVLMPSPYSSRGSIEDSLALSANLGVETLKLPIEPAMEAFAQILADPFFGLPVGLAEENLQARIRGTLMMALSNKFGRLVFTTGNKSEIAVGYSTLYGDTAGALAVIGDLYKSEVYRLCHWLNRDREVIPEIILGKAPSAELSPGQLDQDTLPPYDLLDAILREHIEGNRGADQITAAGDDATLVAEVLRMVRLAEFKRAQLPPVLKISPRAFGVGWQMPIARY